MNNLTDLAQTILHEGNSGTYKLTLDDFRELYRIISEIHDEKIEDTYILLLTEYALVKFKISPNIIIRVLSEKTLSKKDFEIVLSPIFEGNLKPITWLAFGWTEILNNWKIFTIISLSFYFLFYRPQNFQGINTINQLLIDANALFISIFVLFTISQNQELLTNRNLIKQGEIHRLLQNDYYITSISIFSLTLAFISSALLTLSPLPEIFSPITKETFSLGIFTIALTHIALLALLDCFLSVTRYYLKITRTRVEMQMYTLLMSKDNEKDK